jgi:hypothetical protein
MKRQAARRTTGLAPLPDAGLRVTGGRSCRPLGLQRSGIWVSGSDDENFD